MAIGYSVVQRYNLERSLTYDGYDIYSPLIYQTWLYIIPSCLNILYS